MIGLLDHTTFFLLYNFKIKKNNNNPSKFNFFKIDFFFLQHGVGVEIVKILPETHPPNISNVFCECASNDDMVRIFKQKKLILEKPFSRHKWGLKFWAKAFNAGHYSI